MLKRAFYFLIVFALLAVGGYYGWGRLQDSITVDPPQLVTVTRGTFVHEILGRGSVDSARNTEIRVRVEDAGGSTFSSSGGLIINYVVEEGTFVEPGDLLVVLESAWLEERVERQLVELLRTENMLIQSTADLANAKLALDEYLEGTLPQRRMSIETSIFSAEEQVRTQQDNFAHSQRLFERGYITQAQVDAAEFERDRAELTLTAAKLDLNVLETFTKESVLNLRKAAIEIAENRVEMDRQGRDIARDRLTHLRRQLANCRIYAPTSGQVVYFVPRLASEDTLIREGMRVVNQQILLLLPDPTQMQVRGLVNEANVRFVRPGQKATVRLEAFPGQLFEGEVTTVNNMPEPVSFMGGTMSREYLVTVGILNPPEGIRTGLTAEMRVVVNEIPNALLLPTQAVFEYGGQMYAVTFNEGKWDKVEVRTGPANNLEVVILEGLKAGDQVVLGAWAHRDRIELPTIDTLPQQDEQEEELLELIYPGILGGGERPAAGVQPGGSGESSRQGNGEGGGEGPRRGQGPRP